MNLAVELVLALIFGAVFSQRITALFAYVASALFGFTWASVAVITSWAGGSQSALGHFPHAAFSQVIAFGLVNLVVLLIGLALVEAGHRIGMRLRSARGPTVDLDSVR